MRGIGGYCNRLGQIEISGAVVNGNANVSSTGAIHIGAEDAVDLERLAACCAICQCISQRCGHGVPGSSAGDRGGIFEVRSSH